MITEVKKHYYSEVFPVVQELEAAYQAIRREFLTVHSQELYAAWPEKFLYNEGWNVFGLRFMWNDNDEAHALCPALSAIIRRNPKLIATAGFSILNPGTVIYPHEGYQESVLRCHLGIQVPEGDCHLRVNGELLTWKNGEAFVFDDTYTHEAWNLTGKRRIVLLVDLQRDLLLASAGKTTELAYAV